MAGKTNVYRTEKLNWSLCQYRCRLSSLFPAGSHLCHLFPCRRVIVLANSRGKKLFPRFRVAKFVRFARFRKNFLLLCRFSLFFSLFFCSSSFKLFLRFKRFFNFYYPSISSLKNKNTHTERERERERERRSRATKNARERSNPTASVLETVKGGPLKRTFLCACIHVPIDDFRFDPREERTFCRTFRGSGARGVLPRVPFRPVHFHRELSRLSVTHHLCAHAGRSPGTMPATMPPAPSRKTIDSLSGESWNDPKLLATYLQRTVPTYAFNTSNEPINSLISFSSFAFFFFVVWKKMYFRERLLQSVCVANPLFSARDLSLSLSLESNQFFSHYRVSLQIFFFF